MLAIFILAAVIGLRLVIVAGYFSQIPFEKFIYGIGFAGAAAGTAVFFPVQTIRRINSLLLCAEVEAVQGQLWRKKSELRRFSSDCAVIIGKSRFPVSEKQYNAFAEGGVYTLYFTSKPRKILSAVCLSTLKNP